MNDLKKALSYFFFIQRFFKSKRIYLIFILYFLATIVEVINIGIIIPFVNILVYPDTLNEKFYLINYLNLNFNLEDINIKIYFLLTIVLLFFLKTIFLIISNKVQLNFYAEMRYKITNFFYKLHINLPYTYHIGEKKTSNVIRNISMVSSSYSSFLERFLIVVNDLILFIGILIYFIFFYFEIFVSVFLPLALFGTIFYLSSRKMFYNLGDRLLFLTSQIIKSTKDSLDNILQIKLLRKEKFFEGKFYEMSKENSYKIAKLGFFQNLPKILVEFLGVIIIASILIFLLKIETKKEEILSILMVVLVISYRAIPFFTKLINFLNYYSSFIPNMIILKNEINKNDQNILKNENNFLENKIEIKHLENIKLTNVSFRYSENQKYIFKDINLEFNKNNLYGISGVSGAGKSTLVNVIVGLLEPTEGQRFINNLNSDNCFIPRISYVSQKNYLQNSSLKNNIAYGIDENLIDKNKVYECIKLCKLENLVNNLDKGIETQVSEFGDNLSVGQIQRISIARSLYFDSALVILDEPTSSLDLKNKLDIQEMIKTIKNNRIIIMISHDKNELNICDRIVKVENNSIKII